MPESALLTKIVNDYCEQGDEQKFQRGLLESFCKYAAQWLADNSCVGLGHAASGLTLRFADGREFSLFSGDNSFVTPDQPAVPISATKEKLVVTTVADKSRDVPITGRG